VQRETLYLRGRGVLGRGVVFLPLGEEGKTRQSKCTRSLMTRSELWYGGRREMEGSRGEGGGVWARERGPGVGRQSPCIVLCQMDWWGWRGYLLFVPFLCPCPWLEEGEEQLSEACVCPHCGTSKVKPVRGGNQQEDEQV